MVFPNHLGFTLSKLIIIIGLQIANGNTSKTLPPTPCAFCRQDGVSVDFSAMVSIEDYIATRYNVSDLLPFVSKISSEFKIITCPFLESLDTSARLIPEAVASWNAELSIFSSETGMEVWMDVMLDPSSENIAEFLYDLQVVIYTANEIHPGTVTTLIFPANMVQVDAEYFEGAFTVLNEVFPRSMFKLAVEWNPHAFVDQMKGEPSVLAAQIEQSFHLIDYIIFPDFLHDNAIYSTPIKDLLQPQIDVVMTCVQYIKENANSNISFGVSGGMTDTADNGLIVYSRFVQILKQFVSWGKSENMTVLLYHAFDSPSIYTLSYLTSGWWRLVENSSYGSTAEYIFEDKQTIAEREKEKTPEKLISLIQKDVPFDRKKVAVRFNPALSPVNAKKQHRFNFSSVPLLLDTIATKFSIVSICHLGGIWRSLNPLVFAQYNEQAKTPLSVMYTLNLTDENEVDFTAEKIVRANQLHPNTIIKVHLICCQNTTNSSIFNLRTKLSSYGSESVQVGALEPIELCSGGDDWFLFRKLERLLEAVDFLHFGYTPGSSNHVSYKFGVDRVLAQTITLFESCKRRIGNLFPGMQVGFETGFPDTLMSREEDYVSLVLYWKEMNAWATRTNTSIIMDGAFDASYAHDDGAILSHLGWWKVYENPVANNELVIEEKRKVALKRYQHSTAVNNAVTETGGLTIPITVSTLVIISVTLLVLLILVCKYKSKASKRYGGISYASQLKLKNDDIIILPDTSFNTASSTLIGTGNFGTVYKCYMVQLQCDVAVKIVSSDVQMDASDKVIATKSLLSEIRIMSHVGQHENILRILGVCQEGNLFLVTEYCVHSSLLSYLRSESLNETVPSMYELLQFCMEISNGMSYLETKSVIHGDLSARNVLLNYDKCCKICDFGLSRKLERYEKYMKRGEEPLPWRWMAVESLTEMEFSAKSDVWSMGVTFWEVFTLGKSPFPTMKWNEEFCKKLADGLRLEKPQLAKDDFYNIMQSCWKTESTSRPSAKEISAQILQLKRNEYVKM